ncbi:MAG: helix-hairpin-helix domain-containing protein [Paludibacteraceae bacterium]|nr:helix-hairpin-helix domain-containing protein [Paludibacteraceae bacterium]
MWKEFFFFSKGERNGLIVLVCLILLMFAINFCLPSQATMPNEVSNIKEQTDSLLAADQDTTLAFLGDTSWQRKESSAPRGHYTHERRATSRKRETYRAGKWTATQQDRRNDAWAQKKSVYEHLRIELNSADTTELKQLRGIGSKLSQRIVKYRKKIGGFTRKEQLKDIYGLSEETYRHILPHVWVDTTARVTKGSSGSD